MLKMWTFFILANALLAPSVFAQGHGKSAWIPVLPSSLSPKEFSNLPSIRTQIRKVGEAYYSLIAFQTTEPQRNKAIEKLGTQDGAKSIDFSYSSSEMRERNLKAFDEAVKGLLAEVSHQKKEDPTEGDLIFIASYVGVNMARNYQKLNQNSSDLQYHQKDFQDCERLVLVTLYEHYSSPKDADERNFVLKGMQAAYNITYDAKLNLTALSDSSSGGSSTGSGGNGTNYDNTIGY